LDISPNFILFAITAALTPGPNNIMIMASGLNYGIRASLPHFLGVSIGVPAVFLAIGYGLAYVFERYPVLHLIVKVIGTAYLLYLAWRIASSKPSSLDSEKSKPLSFMQAMMFQWVNPKAVIVGTSVFAAYTTLDQNINWQIFGIVLVMFIVTVISIGVWLVFGVALTHILTKPKHFRVFNVTMAALLVIAIWPIIKELAIDFAF